MTKKVLTTPVSDADIESLKIGDVFYLSGALITSRDMVHFRHVEEGMDLPYDLAGKAIFHAGPIMVPDDKSRSGFRVVSIGPTTSMRMEKYEREFLRKTGVKIVVGKGGMGPETAAGCQESKAVHCVFPGGCAVLAAECVEEVEERHWPELDLLDDCPSPCGSCASRSSVRSSSRSTPMVAISSRRTRPSSTGSRSRSSRRSAAR